MPIRSSQSGTVYSLGSLNMDFQARTDQWPVQGATIPARDFLMAGGGKAANVAYQATLLGVSSRLIALCGEDALAKLALDPLERLGVDISLVRQVKGRATGVALITVGPDADKAIVLADNANEAWSDLDAKAATEALLSAPEGSVLAIDLEVSSTMVRKAMGVARERGIRVVLDPSPAARMEADLYPMVDFITPNPKEAETLTGIAVGSVEEAFRAADALRGKGVGTALVKLKDGGCVVVGADLREVLHAAEVQPVDKTGAGDAFAGTLSAALVKGRSTLDSARLAVQASTLSVTRFGAQASYASSTELQV